jgi:ArsR family transcriptional regulator, lead/cadmium/zinc/bismuth-responsive transcriptional repressor
MLYELIYEYLFIYSYGMKLTELKAIQLAELFSALSDASRVRIIAILLEGEMSVSTLAKGLTMSESAVSHQLRGLRQMHLVRARKSGRQVFYSLADAHVSRLFSLGLEHVQHG